MSPIPFITALSTIDSNATTLIRPHMTSFAVHPVLAHYAPFKHDAQVSPYLAEGIPNPPPAETVQAIIRHSTHLSKTALRSDPVTIEVARLKSRIIQCSRACGIDVQEACGTINVSPRSKRFVCSPDHAPRAEEPLRVALQRYKCNKAMRAALEKEEMERALYSRPGRSSNLSARPLSRPSGAIRSVDSDTTSDPSTAPTSGPRITLTVHHDTHSQIEYDFTHDMEDDFEFQHVENVDSVEQEQQTEETDIPNAMTITKLVQSNLSVFYDIANDILKGTVEENARRADFLRTVKRAGAAAVGSSCTRARSRSRPRV